jgi:DNA-binding beta-propeller fold protein YncE
MLELKATRLRAPDLTRGFHWFAILVVCTGSAAACARPVAGSAVKSPPIAPPHGYHVVHGWPVLPEGEILGPVAGVGVDSHDDVLVFHRAERASPASNAFDLTPIAVPTVLHFDGRTGVLLGRWGADLFVMPHGLTVDRQDNVWLTDVALQQVYKFSHDGHLLLTLGERGVAGDDRAHFNRPTKVAVAPDGSFYVSDGYRNSRVLKFAPDGQFVFQWGTKGTGPGQFDVPHGIALDAGGLVYVADRSNARIQIFDGAGHYIREWKGGAIGRPFDVAIGPDANTFIVDGGDLPSAPPDRSGLVVLRPDGTVVVRFGRFGNYDGEFAVGHDLAVATDGAVYVGDIKGRRVQKFVRD